MTTPSVPTCPQLRRCLPLVLLLLFSLPASHAYADKGNKRNRGGNNTPTVSHGHAEKAPRIQASFGTVRDFIARGLKADVDHYDLGKRIENRIARMEVVGDVKESKDALRRVYAEIFSEFSRDNLAELFVGLQDPDKPNAMVLGKPGVGKTFLVDQLAWMLTHDVMPQYLRERLNITEEGTPASENAKEFLGRTNVIRVNMQLLIKSTKVENGVIDSQENRVKKTLTKLFAAAKKEYNNGEGNRTVFVFEEIGNMPDYVIADMKEILDEGGWRPRDYKSFAEPDPGFHVIGITTHEEYQDLLKGDGATDRRYPTKALVVEPSDQETFDLVRKTAHREWARIYRGIQIEDGALRYIVTMKRYLDWPPSAAPNNVLSAAAKLYRWKTHNPGADAMLITLADAQLFLQSNIGLTDIWFPGPNGEPALTGLADEVKEYVVGHDDVIEKIADRITTWARLKRHSPPPVFFLGGPTGSGKDTIVMAFNMVLFGNPNGQLMFNFAGKRGFAVDAMIEGPPLGNHSDADAGVIQSRLDETRGNGMIALNEVYDLPAEEFEKLKVVVENGELQPVGKDRRTRPIKFPMFFMGQFGEELWMDENGKIDPDIELAQLTDELIDEQFLQGKDVEGERIGAVPQPLLDRGKKTGGVYLIGPVPTSKYPEVINIWLKVISRQLEESAGITIIVDDELIDLMVRTAKESGLQVRGLYGVMSDYTETAISKAQEQGLPTNGDIELILTVSEDKQRIRIEYPEFAEKFDFNPEDLLRGQMSGCPGGFTAN